MKSKEEQFAEINDYFDAIYVITLDGYTERQQSIIEHFEGLKYTFWAGTDKRKLPENTMHNKALYDDVAHKLTKRTSRSMSLGEYCCAMSHVNIYKDMIEKKYKRVLIFEDDAVPVTTEIPFFSEQMSSLPNDWDLVLFDYYDHYLPTIQTTVKQFIYHLYHSLHIANWHLVPRKLIDRIVMKEFNQHFFIPGKVSGSHSYAISEKAAKHYIEYQTPVKLQADRIFYYYQQYEVLNEFASKKPIFTTGEVAKVTTI